MTVDSIQMSKNTDKSAVQQARKDCVPKDILDVLVHWEAGMTRKILLRQAVQDDDS